MKKFFVVALACAVAFSLLFSVSCAKKTSNPSGPSATATPIVNSTFAAGTESWSIPAPAVWNQENALSGLVWDSVNGNTNTASSAGCLSMTGDYDTSGNTLHAKGNVELSFAAPTDVTGKTYKAWVKVPAGMLNGAYHAVIYMKTGAPGYHYCAGADVIVGTSDWLLLQATTDSMAVNTGSTFVSGDLAIVSTIGVDFYRDPTTATNASKDVTGQTILIDDISLK